MLELRGEERAEVVVARIRKKPTTDDKMFATAICAIAPTALQQFTIPRSAYAAAQPCLQLYDKVLTNATTCY
jgi:hypothetical protein